MKQITQFYSSQSFNNSIWWLGYSKSQLHFPGRESYQHKILWFVSDRSTADFTFNLIVIINPFSVERSSSAGVGA